MPHASAPYPYLFQTSGFPRVDKIRAEIESQGDWDHSDNSVEAGINLHKAAQRFGFFPPYTAEQNALAKVLTDKRAGLLISTYAWGLYAEAASEAPARRRA